MTRAGRTITLVGEGAALRLEASRARDLWAVGRHVGAARRLLAAPPFGPLLTASLLRGGVRFEVACAGRVVLEWRPDGERSSFVRTIFWTSLLRCFWPMAFVRRTSRSADRRG